MQLELSHSAREELKEIDGHYLRISSVLANKFLSGYLSTLKFIQSFPESGIIFRKKYRLFLVVGFPYILVCSYSRNRITIVHILHERRHPKHRIHRIK